MATIGVLALQGGFAAHAVALERLGHRAVLVRNVAALEGLSGIVLPGGESTTQLKLLESTRMLEPLAAFVRQGHPVLATCAGLILLAADVLSPAQRSLGVLDVSVVRNGYGPQADSFEARSDDHATRLVFIRAPRITRVGAAVSVLSTHRGEPVLVRRGNVTAATFHPELTDDVTIHQASFGGGAPRAWAPERRLGR